MLNKQPTRPKTNPTQNSYAALDYKEHFIVTADLDTLLPAAAASSDSTQLLAPADVQAAVTEALLAAEEDGLSEGTDPLDVCVHVDVWVGGLIDCICGMTLKLKQSQPNTYENRRCKSRCRTRRPTPSSRRISPSTTPTSTVRTYMGYA